MNICFISEQYPEETGWGGIATYVHTLAHALSKQGNFVSVICKAVQEEREYLDGNVHIYRIKPKSIKLSFIPNIIQGLLKDVINHFEYSYAVYQKFKEIKKVDIVECAETRFEGYFLLKKKIAPIVIRLHTPSFLLRKINKEKYNINKNLIEKLEKFGILNSDGISSCSENLNSIVTQKFHLYKNKIKTIPNPINLEDFTLNGKVENDILFCGRLQTLKGIYTFAQAIPYVSKKFPLMKFIFLGYNPKIYEQNLSKEKLTKFFIKEKVLEKVEFLPMIEREKVISYYQKAKICVVPSRWENFPYTCLEAMACGKPVVGSNAGGIKEIIEDKISGLLFEPDNYYDLANKIIFLLKNEKKAEEIGNNAYKKIQAKFDAPIIAKKMLKFYEKVL